jgi:hypothetical protein
MAVSLRSTGIVNELRASVECPKLADSVEKVAFMLMVRYPLGIDRRGANRHDGSTG